MGQMMMMTKKKNKTKKSGGKKVMSLKEGGGSRSIQESLHQHKDVEKTKSMLFCVKETTMYLSLSLSSENVHKKHHPHEQEVTV